MMRILQSPVLGAPTTQKSKSKINISPPGGGIPKNFPLPSALWITLHWDGLHVLWIWLDSLLKALELGMDVVLSDTESHRGENWRGREEGSEIERRIATFLDNDTVSAQVKDAFFFQVLLGWEDAFQGRFSIRWSAISTPGTRSGFQDSSRYWWIGAEHAGLTDAKQCLDRGKTNTSSNESACFSMWITGTILQERRHWLTNQNKRPVD